METVSAEIGAIVVRPKGELVVSTAPGNHDDRFLLRIIAEHLAEKGCFCKLKTIDQGLALLAL